MYDKVLLKNEILWKDKATFNLFLRTVNQLAATFSSGDSTALLNSTNQLDDLMQAYEEKYDNVLDPNFYWWFAMGNAILYHDENQSQADKEMRSHYAVNGMKTALSKHLRSPSFTTQMIHDGLEVIEKCAYESKNLQWVRDNRSLFVGIDPSK